MTTTYKFAGDGACVPGLPLEITEEQASQLGDAERTLLNNAVASGVYIEIGAERPVRVSTTTPGGKRPASGPAESKKAEPGSAGE